VLIRRDQYAEDWVFIPNLCLEGVGQFSWSQGAKDVEIDKAEEGEVVHSIVGGANKSLAEDECGCIYLSSANYRRSACR